MKSPKPRRRTKLLITGWARRGIRLKKNSTRICRPRISDMLAAKEIATIWESITMSMAPKRRHRKTLAPTTSMQVITIISSIAASPNHSHQPLSRRLHLSPLPRNILYPPSFSHNYLLPVRQLPATLEAHSEAGQ